MFYIHKPTVLYCNHDIFQCVGNRLLCAKTDRTRSQNDTTIGFRFYLHKIIQCKLREEANVMPVLESVGRLKWTTFIQSHICQSKLKLQWRHCSCAHDPHLGYGFEKSAIWVMIKLSSDQIDQSISCWEQLMTQRNPGNVCTHSADWPKQSL